MRKKLQGGWGRTAFGLIAAALSFIALIYYWDALIRNGVNPLDAGQKVAFVAAAFSVTAYNLRTRVVDLTLKIAGDPSRVSALCAIARGCGRKLTNLVILFTVTALAMGAGGFIPITHFLSKWFSCVAVAMFGLSVVQFVYVLFAFERLERFMLDDAEEAARRKEADRLVAGQSG